MGKKKHNDFIGCIGSVRVLTVDGFVFQGQVEDCKDDKDDKDDERKSEYIQPHVDVDVDVESENEFICLELECDVAVVRENANVVVTNPPIFEAGDLVKINVANIIAVGPSDGCFEKGKDKED